jgi:hypothetical protein
MKLLSTLSALLFFAFLSTTEGSFGSIWTLTIPDGAPRIIELEATVELPNSPILPRGQLSLWAGMITENADFIQTLFIAYSQEDIGSGGCQGKITTGEFCVEAYALGNGGQQIVVSDQQTAVEGNAALDVHYTMDRSSGNVTQIATKGGQDLSNLTTRMSITHLNFCKLQRRSNY